MLEHANLVGYWNNHSETKYVDPHKLVIKWLPETKKKVVAYLVAGKFHGGFMGWSNCRFCGEDVGSTELTDGNWVWPFGLPHYIDKHDVSLPKEFLEHIQNNNFALPKEINMKMCSLEFWLRYCKSI
jgi:hypothetical protein